MSIVEIKHPRVGKFVFRVSREAFNRNVPHDLEKEQRGANFASGLVPENSDEKTKTDASGSPPRELSVVGIRVVTAIQ